MSTRPLPTSRWLRRIVQPFERDQTGRWKERQKILTLLENIKQRADEAEKCLTVDEYGQKKPDQAARALEELEELWNELRRFAPEIQRLNAAGQAITRKEPPNIQADEN